MARFATDRSNSGTVSPVIFEVEFFNLGMTYQAGIFIITDPGYYQLTAQCSHYQTSSHSRFDVMVDSEHKLTTFGKFASDGSTTGIFYLEAFDTVFVHKTGATLDNGAVRNNFMIQKV